MWREYNTNEDEGISIHVNMSESALMRNNFPRAVQVRPDCGRRFNAQSNRGLFSGFPGNRVLLERWLLQGRGMVNQSRIKMSCCEKDGNS